MPKLALRISLMAADDLSDIWHFTANRWSPSRADRYYQGIIRQIELLRQMPHSGKLMSHILSGYRGKKVMSHQIFYKATKDTLYIIRIFHERMDIRSRLKEPLD